MRQGQRQSEPAGPRNIIETEIAVFARALESFGRQSDVYAKLDRAAYVLLRALFGLGPASVNALAAALGVEASTVTRQAAALWYAKLLERQVDLGSAVEHSQPDWRG
ncbi:MAG TPA: MarR family winged helix-turn-helix transcriptional regulator [Mycobacteriales bacterium]|jgi:DNA-binding MarR family transcriptional regulator|nr:MarR family winged helix-turn-helix transcriptional regulator [Mycobacteriales bacterium]